MDEHTSKYGTGREPGDRSSGAPGSGRDEVPADGDRVRREPSGSTDPREMATKVKEEAEARMKDVKHEAERQVEKVTTSMGHRATSVARALSAAERKFRDDDEGALADMAAQAADRLERMAGYLDDENPSAMLSDFEDLGRNNPGAFLGSAFTLGLVAGRFLRASRPSNGHTGASSDPVGRTAPETPGPTPAPPSRTATPTDATEKQSVRDISTPHPGRDAPSGRREPAAPASTGVGETP